MCSMKTFTIQYRGNTTSGNSAHEYIRGSELDQSEHSELGRGVFEQIMVGGDTASLFIVICYKLN